MKWTKKENGTYFKVVEIHIVLFFQKFRKKNFLDQLTQLKFFKPIVGAVSCESALKSFYADIFKVPIIEDSYYNCESNFFILGNYTFLPILQICENLSLLHCRTLKQQSKHKREVMQLPFHPKLSSSSPSRSLFFQYLNFFLEKLIGHTFIYLSHLFCRLLCHITNFFEQNSIFL